MSLIKLAVTTAIVVTSFFASSSVAQTLDQNLRITLETPQYDGQIGQIGQIRGWALHPNQIVDFIEIYIDGEFFSGVPVGGQRNDVYNAYPDAVNSRYSGWAQTVNFKNFAEGYHSLEIRAYTTFGNYNSVTGKFCVEKFAFKDFISDPNTIDFNSIEMFHKAQNALLLQKVTIDGRYYNMELNWDTATQGFIIEQVEPYVSKDYIQDTDYDGWCTLCKE
jgi:hypothetical protein